ncbi:MAG: hypothetical protein V4701_00795 [Pseudomonadota bacterium]
MSAARRWMSGGLASGTRMGVGAATQLASVPIFLSCWSPSQYGAWLIVLGLGPLLTAIDVGHQNYLAYAFMNAPDEASLGRVLASSLIAGTVIGILGVVAATGLVWSGAVAFMLKGAEAAVVEQAQTLVVLQSVIWLLVGSFGGLLTRAMARIGQFPRAAWWGVVEAVGTGVAPAVAVLMGGDLMAAGLALAAATVIVNAPMLGDFARLWSAVPERVGRPDLRLAARNAGVSLGIAARDLSAQMRQQGVRLVLAPMVGLSQMTAFATTRTGANIAVQGLNAVLWPLEPELLRFVRERDAERVEAALAVNWGLLMVVVVPTLMAVQFVAAPAFAMWTRGQVPFDPVLFALLSATVAVFAFAQTATLVVRGANRVRVQMATSLLSTAVVLIGIAVTATSVGIRGAAVALIAGEVCVAVIYQDVARRWITAAVLCWPAALARPAILATVSLVAALLAIGWAPEFGAVIAAVAGAVHIGLCLAFYRALPALARERIAGWVSPLGAASGRVWRARGDRR